MENKIIERLDEYMRYAGLNDNKVTVQCGLSNSIIGNARKRGKSLNGDNIVKIISSYRDLNARWLLTGEGEMLSSDVVQSDSEIIQFLKKQNKELMDKIDQLNRELGDKERQIAELKKEDVHIGVVADNADAKSYGLVK